MKRMLIVLTLGLLAGCQNLLLVGPKSWSSCDTPELKNHECKKIDVPGNLGGDLTLVRHDAQKTGIPKKIMVFFDGTSNGPLSQEKVTNIWRLYEEIVQDNEAASLYVEGVGSNFAKKTFPLHEIPREAFGAGMTSRINVAYQFLAENYKPGDKIYLFGFSRGAIQARALAGFLAYAGLPKTGIDIKQAGDIFDKVRTAKDAKNAKDDDLPTKEKWIKWSPNDEPLVTPPENPGKRFEMQAVEVEFLGVWDTVLGISDKGGKLEAEFKEDGYKMGSYPPIRHIAQALSLDEKREKFAQINMYAPFQPDRPKVIEVGFPGAHADVGGGYGGADDGCSDPALCTALPNISFNWMVRQLADSGYAFAHQITSRPEDPKGLAHWSMGYSKASLGSLCIDRQATLPANLVLDPSVGVREESGKVPILVLGPSCKQADMKRHDMKYPVSCADLDKQYCEQGLLPQVK